MLKLNNYLAPTDTDSGISSDNLSEVTPMESPVGVDESNNTPANEPIPDAPSDFEIDGEKFTVDEIREWKKGNMRQADYTRKTQELSKQRKEAEEALGVYNYLMQNQDLTKMLVEHQQQNGGDSSLREKVDPTLRELNEIKQKMVMDDIDRQLNEITTNDKRVSDVELLEIANNSKCDINTAYNIWKGANIDKIMAQRESELKKSIMAEIQNNTVQTQTLIGGKDAKVESNTFGLTDAQIAMAERFDMTLEEYKKYMSNDNVW
ncbi:MAG: hypothetical protein ACRC2K_13350 [Clostridium sp.]